MVFFQPLPLFDARCPKGVLCDLKPCLFNHDSQLDGLPTDKLLSRLNQRKPKSKDTKETVVMQQEERPKLKLAMNMKFSWQLRQNFIDKFYDILVTYHSDPSKQAFREEAAIYHQCKQSSVYRSVGLARIKSLQLEATKATKELKNEVAYDADLLEELLLKDLTRFPTDLQSKSPPLPTEVECARCKKPFNPVEPRGKCQFHHGRLFRPSRNERVYSCCHGADMAKPCCTEDFHVFVRDCVHCGDTGLFEVNCNEDALPIIAIDGEMVHTKKGMELARLSIVDWDLNTILDEWIQPSSTVIDYNTRYSGVTAASLTSAISMSDLRAKLQALLGNHTIIVGHSVDNDLWSLGLVHLRIIDTAHLYRETKNGNTPGLRALTRQHLGERIQEGSEGHDSVEDARSTMRLLKLKL